MNTLWSRKSTLFMSLTGYFFVVISSTVSGHLRFERHLLDTKELQSYVSAFSLQFHLYYRSFYNLFRWVFSLGSQTYCLSGRLGTSLQLPGLPFPHPKYFILRLDKVFHSSLIQVPQGGWTLLYFGKTNSKQHRALLILTACLCVCYSHTN